MSVSEVGLGWTNHGSQESYSGLTLPRFGLFVEFELPIYGYFAMVHCDPWSVMVVCLRLFVSR